MATNATPITIKDARTIYAGLGLSEKELLEEVEQANYYGLRDACYTPEGLARSYARQYHRERECDERATCQFKMMAYGR